MNPIALSEAVEPQLYLPPADGDPVEACWVNAIRLPVVAYLAATPAPAELIFQLVGKFAVAFAPRDLKFSETELFNAVMAICPQLKFTKMSK
jgi:hypothetical protein